MAITDVAKEMLGGIFSANKKQVPEAPEGINTPEQQKLVDLVTEDYNVFREHRQPMDDVWRKEQRVYKGDHWNGMRPPQAGPYPDRMEYVGNFAWSQIESIVARLTGWTPEPDFVAQEEGDEETAKLLNAYIPWELNQIKFKPKHIRSVRRMVIHGPLIYKTIHDPDFIGGKGMAQYKGINDVIPVTLGSFFPDPAVKDFINLQKGRAHIINTLQTLEAIAERWTEQGEKVMADNQSSDSEIFDIDSETSEGTSYGNSNRSTTTNVLEYWYKGKPKLVTEEDKVFFEQEAADKLEGGKDPSEDLAKSEGVMDGVHCIYITTSGVYLEHKAYVYDHGQYPIVARTLFPEENNPWGKGYMRDLISPQTMLNRFSELAIEVTSKMGNAAIVYGTAAGITESIKAIWRRFRGQAGAMLPVDDVSQVKELQGIPPNPGIMQYIQHFIEMMQRIPGVYDSANGNANPNVTSGRQSEALIAAAQGRLSVAAELIEDAVQEVMEQYIALCAQFYRHERMARIAGKRTGFSRDALVKGTPSTFPQPQEDGTSVDIPVTEEYVPSFDIKVNIGVEKPKDREYYVQMAFTLLKTIDPVTQQPMIDAQAVKYTIENGRMEPMSVIEERMQVAQQQMMQMQQLQQQSAQLQAENDVLYQKFAEKDGHVVPMQQQSIA